MAGGDFLLVEAGAVVDDGHEALTRSLLDPHLGPPGLRVLAGVGEPFLDDAEDLDLLVGREPDPVLDLEVDLEPAVGGEEVDVTAKAESKGAEPPADESASTAKRASCWAAAAASLSCFSVRSGSAPFSSIDA